jgi:hypothetical protein
LNNTWLYSSNMPSIRLYHFFLFLSLISSWKGHFSKVQKSSNWNPDQIIALQDTSYLLYNQMEIIHKLVSSFTRNLNSYWTQWAMLFRVVQGCSYNGQGCSYIQTSVWATYPFYASNKHHVCATKKHSSIFEHIWDIFKEYSRNMFNMSNA